MSDSSNELRSTGPLENWSIGRHLEDFYFGVTSFIKLTSPMPLVSRDVIYGRIVEATKVSFWSNFNLRTTIDFSAGKICTLSQGNIKIDVTWYARKENSSIETVLESEVNKKFPEVKDQPLWRVWVVVPEHEFDTFELGITVHHAFADGLSSANILHIFTHAFMASKSGPIPDSEGPAIISYDPLADTKVAELSKPIHTILPNSKPPVTVFIKALAKYLLPEFLRPKDVYWSGTKELDLETIRKISSKPKQYPTKIMTMSIPLDSLAQKSKIHNTTVHAALSIAFILASHVLKPKHPLKFATPVNLRPYCEPPLPQESIGVYASKISTTHAPPEASDLENFWPMATKFKEQMSTNLAPAIYTIGLMEYIPNFRSFLHSERAALAQVNGHQGSLEISNLGKHDWKDLPESPFNIEELGFAQSTSVLNPVFTVSAVTWKNTCKLTLSYLLDVNEPQDVARFWAEFQTLLNSV